MEHVQQVDELCLEYLLFRGFTQAFRAFNTERNADKVAGFDVNKIVQQLFDCINAYDIAGLLALWDFLDARFFSHLDAEFSETVRRMKLGLARCYAVHAVKSGNVEKAREFFEQYAETLMGGGKASGTGATAASGVRAASGIDADEWRAWFALPFTKQPQHDPRFAPYFAADYSDRYALSLKNFLALIFQNMPLPKLLAFTQARLAQQALQCELLATQAELQRVCREKQLAESQLQRTRAVTTRLNKHLLHFVHHAQAQKAVDELHRGLGGATSSSSGVSVGADAISDSLTDTLRRTERVLGEDLASSTSSGAGADSSADHVGRSGCGLAKAAIMGAGMAATDATGGFRDGVGGQGSVSPQGQGGHDEHGVDGALMLGLEDEAGEDFTSAMPQNAPAGTIGTNAVGIGATAAAADQRAAVATGQNDGGGTIDDSVMQDAAHGSQILDPTDALHAHNDSVTCCRFSPDGCHLATGGKDATVRFWRMEPLEGGGLGCAGAGATCFCASEILSMDWAPSGTHANGLDQLLLFGTASRSIKLWSVAEKQVAVEMTVEPELARVSALSCSPQRTFVAALNPPLSAAGQYAAAGGGAGGAHGPAGALAVWDIKVARPVHSIPLDPGPCTLSTVMLNHNGTLCVAGGSDGMVRVFDVRQASALMGWQTHGDGVLGVTFVPDETAVVSTGANGRMQQWSLRQMGGDPEFTYEARPAQDAMRVDLAYHENGKYLLSSGGGDEGAALYKKGCATPVQRITGHDAVVTSVDWHPTRDTCATGSADSFVRLWSIRGNNRMSPGGTTV